jgi:hypothetical protein
MAILTSAGITFGDATTQSTAATTFAPSGTIMLFVQTAAPTGWTKSTTHDNKALRVVSGTASSGGSTSFTSAFGTPTVTGSTTVSGTTGNATATGSLGGPSATVTVAGQGCGTGLPAIVVATSGHNHTFSGSAHNHSFSGTGSLTSGAAAINVQYVDVIIATKN